MVMPVLLFLFALVLVDCIISNSTVTNHP